MRSAAVVAAFALVAGALGRAEAAPKDAWIVFAASPQHGTQPEQLFRVHLSGRGLRQITTGHYAVDDPAFAPNGRRIAFARLGRGLFVVTIDGTGLRRLTPNAGDRYPAWSPKGGRIAFIRPGKAGYRIWTMEAGGGQQHQLRSAPVLPAAERVDWMPDGLSLVVAFQGGFYRLDAGTGEKQQRLAPTWAQTGDAVSWSLAPDGRTLAYLSRRPEPAGCVRNACDVYALYVQHTRSVRPLRSVDDAGVPGWSPDARRVVYGRIGALNVQATAGGVTRTISVGDAALGGEGPPAWQPN
jgi:Tol biopolymer transport system component